MSSNAPSIARLLDFTGRVVLVTGASGNIGAGIARRFHEAGASVVVHTSRRGDLAAGLVDELGDRAAVAVGDVERDSASIVDQALVAFGRLDVLVNNAGIQPVGPLQSLSNDDVAEMLRINVGGVIAMTRDAAALMSTNERRQGIRGAIVNIASIEGMQPARLHSHYVASKGAVVIHTRAAALELGAMGIRVNAVSPGLINVDGLDRNWPEGVDRWHRAAPLGRLGEPDDIADAAVFLGSDAARWITGANLVVDGGVLSNNTW
jgi:NAD(P)-dependent dehydrogenase (short-subunit alcohol dehydrogenase family)